MCDSLMMLTGREIQTVSALVDIGVLDEVPDPERPHDCLCRVDLPVLLAADSRRWVQQTCFFAEWCEQDDEGRTRVDAYYTMYDPYLDVDVLLVKPDWPYGSDGEF